MSETKTMVYEIPDLQDLFSKLGDEDLIRLYQELLQESDEMVEQTKTVDPALAVQRAAYEEEMEARGLESFIRRDC